MTRPAIRSQTAWRVLLAGLVYVLLATALYAAPVFLR